jgi:hypothetical protein
MKLCILVLALASAGVAFDTVPPKAEAIRRLPLSTTSYVGQPLRPLRPLDFAMFQQRFKAVKVSKTVSHRHSTAQVQDGIQK